MAMTAADVSTLTARDWAEVMCAIINNPRYRQPEKTEELQTYIQRFFGYDQQADAAKLKGLMLNLDGYGYRSRFLEDLLPHLSAEGQRKLQRCAASDGGSWFGRHAAIHLAAARGSSQILRLMLDPKSSSERGKKRKLGANSVEGSREMKDMKDLADSFGRTPLLYSAMNGHLELMLELIDKHRCDMGKTDSDGFAAVQWAAMKGHLRIVRCLIEERGVDANITHSGSGDSLLMLAARHDRRDVMVYLIEEKKADVNKKNKVTEVNTISFTACIAYIGYTNEYVQIFSIRE